MCFGIDGWLMIDGLISDVIKSKGTDLHNASLSFCGQWPDLLMVGMIIVSVLHLLA